MSLEAEWVKQRGVGTRAHEPQRPTAGDRLARLVALLLLVIMFGFAFWSLTLVLGEYTFLVVNALFLMAWVQVYFRNRELAERLAAAEKRLEELRAPAAPPPNPPAP